MVSGEAHPYIGWRRTMRVLVTLLCVTLLCAVSGPVTAQPANDSCSTAEAAVAGLVSFDTTLATTDPSAFPGCSLFPSNDVWFTYTNTSGDDLTVVADTVGSSFNTVLGAYDDNGGACPLTAANILVCNDDDAGGPQSLVTIVVPDGETRLFRILGFNGEFGLGSFAITEFPAPRNDDCSTAEIVSTIPATVAIDNHRRNLRHEWSLLHRPTRGRLVRDSRAD